MLKYISMSLAAAGIVLISGCGSVIGEDPKIKVDPIDVPDDVRQNEDNATYLQAVRDARSEDHDCGYYKTDSNGDKMTDKDGNYITIHEGRNEDFRPAIKDDKLRWNEKLYKAAYEHNIDMLSMGKDVDHTGSGGASDRTAQNNHPGTPSTFEERVLANGYQYAKIYENLTAGTDIDTAEKAVKKWIDSAGHCKNLMNPDVIDMGMSHVKKDESHYTNYWTIELAKPAAEEKGIY